MSFFHMQIILSQIFTETLHFPSSTCIDLIQADFMYGVVSFMFHNSQQSLNDSFTNWLTDKLVILMRITKENENHEEN